MPVHRIRLLGDPVLRTRCQAVTKPESPAVRVVLDGMKETLHDWQARFGSGRAIAAPQIGAPLRLVHANVDQPWTLINPEIVARKGIYTSEEKCLSLIREQSGKQFDPKIVEVFFTNIDAIQSIKTIYKG